jgi:hypothetical protein
MSYDVWLEKDGEICRVNPHIEGGTVMIGGSPKAEMSVTYNYSEVYYLFGFTLKSLDGKKAGYVVEELGELVHKLGTKEYKRDYWAPTPGNAGHALNVLLGWALLNPDATFRVEA